jgi:hypothetical protein
MSKLKGAASSFFSTNESFRGRRNHDEVHKCLVLPWDLHRASVEIAFQEGVKFKDMMSIVIGKEVNRLEGLTEQAGNTPSFTFTSPEKDIHTSVFMPKELVFNLKKVAHYSGICEKQIIANGLADYLLLEYGEKYPDLVLQFKDIINNKA